MVKRSLSFLIILLLTPYLQAAAPVCSGVFADADLFAPWTPGKASTVSVKPSDFFPADFLQLFTDAGTSLNLKIGKGITPESLAFHFKTKEGKFVADFEVWTGSKRESAVIENLLLENPLRKDATTKLGYDQDKKGLPGPVFFHVRDRLFEFLKAGGYKELEVLSSQNISVYFLYNRMIGAEPNTEVAKQMNSYLWTIVRMRKEIWGPEAHTMDEITRFMENPAQIGIPGDKLEILKKSGYEGVYDKDGNLIAVRTPQKPGLTLAERTNLVIPFLPGKPAFQSWEKIHKDCPTCMTMTKKLPEHGS
jgi:hypothetical protein